MMGEIFKYVSVQWVSVICLATILPVMGILDNSTGCSGSRQITKVDMSKICSTQYNVQSAVALFPVAHDYSVIPSGMNCSLTFRVTPDHQLTATVYSINTETGENDTCTKNRLDIYDGDKANADQLLSNKTGICGCDVPDEVYKSTNNSMTITFETESSSTAHVQHGTFDVVISAIKKDIYNATSCPGQFECTKSGKCIDKNEVCNGKPNCADKSDETGCEKPTPPPKPHKYPPIWLWILIGLAGLCAVLLLIMIIVICCRRYRNPYTKMP